MVKLINPFFAVSCHGKFGGIIYQTTQYGQVARCHVPQRFKPSTAQYQQNFFFGQAADAWRLLTDEQKKEYNDRAVGLKMTGFNLYIKENIQHP